MKLYVNANKVNAIKYEGYYYVKLLDAEDGCSGGCKTGLLMYTQEQYSQGGIHDDQEGFFVLEGTGRALVGDEEFEIEPGVCFIVPPGTYHYIKKDKESHFVKLFFFHAGI
ncbi:MAG: cupin domain-containing protein [Thermoanaerobacteraceae bacterium]|nr:cupin domain-containing protein [Thermoanaerobacteraceae bacterium]